MTGFQYNNDNSEMYSVTRYHSNCVEYTVSRTVFIVFVNTEIVNYICKSKVKSTEHRNFSHMDDGSASKIARWTDASAY